MQTLVDIIRERVISQISYRSPISYDAALRGSVWVSGDYGIRARVNSIAYNPINRIKNKLKLRINRTNRFVTREFYLCYILLMKKEIEDNEILAKLMNRGSVEKKQLAADMGISIRTLTPRLVKDLDTGNILIENEIIYHIDKFVDQYPNTVSNKSNVTEKNLINISSSGLKRQLILHVIENYPYLSMDQISLLTGIHKYDMVQDLIFLDQNDYLNRGITIQESVTELFNAYNYQDNPDVNWSDFPIFSLERRDALVEIIMMDEEISHGNGDYWFFIEGLPQADFDLIKEGKSKFYKIKNFRRNSIATLATPQILEQIEFWADNNKIKLMSPQLEGINTRLAKSFTNLLVKRGYTLEEDDLILNRSGGVQGKVTRNKIRLHTFSAKLLRVWYRKKQYLSKISPNSVSDLLAELIQLNEVESICHRLGLSPSNLDFDGTTFSNGIFQNNGFIHDRYLPLISNIWPKEIKLGILDEKLLSLLKEGNNYLPDLVKLLDLSPGQTQIRINYLLSVRLIKKIIDPSSQKSYYHPLDQELLEIGGEMDTNKALSEIIPIFLNNHIPLTRDELTMYFGLSLGKLSEVIQSLIRSGELLEGYFIDNKSDVQITTPSVIDELSTPLEEDLPVFEEMNSYERVDILPFNDPVTILHLNPFLMDNPEIMPKKRLSANTTWNSIFWDGNIIGYVLITPDFSGVADIEINIIEKRIKNVILSGIIQKLVNTRTEWFDEKIRIIAINETNPKDSRFELLHFLIESLGIIY